jgi:hypothetical protein
MTNSHTERLERWQHLLRDAAAHPKTPLPSIYPNDYYRCGDVWLDECGCQWRVFEPVRRAGSRQRCWRVCQISCPGGSGPWHTAQWSESRMREHWVRLISRRAEAKAAA